MGAVVDKFVRDRVSAVLALMCVLALVASAIAQSAVPATTRAADGVPTTQGVGSDQAPTAVIRIQGVIDDYAKDVVLAHLAQARKSGAKVIIFDIDTPGGAVGATLEMTRAVRAVNDAKTVAFIDPQAYSAGTIFAVALDEIYMAPESALGDCAPIMVTQTGLQTLGDAERAKLSSPVVADMYASASRNGHNPDVLAAMVLPGRVIHAVLSPEGERKFTDDKGYRGLLDKGYKPIPGVPDPLDGTDTLLTLDNRSAEKVGLSRGTFASVEALAAAKGWAIQQTLEPTKGQLLVQWLNSTAVRGVLLTAFMITMYLSFNVPGHGLPEAVCLTALATLIIVPLLTGYASWLEIVLILLGIGLIALEIFVITGTVIPGLVGGCMVLVGLILTFVPKELPGSPGEWMPPTMPSMPQTWAALQTGLLVVAISLLVSMGGGLWVSRYLPRMPYGRKLILSAVSGQGGSVAAIADDAPGATAHVWPAIGATAVCVSDLRPGGNAEFPDPDGPGFRSVAVISDSGFVAKGTPVRVREVEGARILVRPVAGGAGGSGAGGEVRA